MFVIPGVTALHALLGLSLQTYLMSHVYQDNFVSLPDGKASAARRFSDACPCTGGGEEVDFCLRLRRSTKQPLITGSACCIPSGRVRCGRGRPGRAAMCCVSARCPPPRSMRRHIACSAQWLRCAAGSGCGRLLQLCSRRCCLQPRTHMRCLQMHQGARFYMRAVSGAIHAAGQRALCQQALARVHLAAAAAL